VSLLHDRKACLPGGRLEEGACSKACLLCFSTLRPAWELSWMRGCCCDREDVAHTCLLPTFSHLLSLTLFFLYQLRCLLLPLPFYSVYTHTYLPHYIPLFLGGT